ncbi:hypothetical protein CHGG_01606 [Chaetomium globosum CBS 148.51]|uniref:Mediator of RNA polymerase II transcription subunit 14 n=1 Tax=Chaetomium globosum (strain ATCC 6205 / CBS 148.51 / DSM 1962 / NBRC 6347 / NRRL 1970) TaxID=306901 RepID=MED14_CHAGB|nr:uncharacterized protein CHGG_01606 [Chaetomium globosum CBS 148.51]Q2HDU8.1 RecName: Full=Mediator of RNA polymerase II transcription subunit 14; AltName: Full=Mediator complex subunit 14 [Chaetomium globosum CBS 148.51]EAQ93371.1 hypothetical protein CHGG_01606 [Chaetomium globosum CBS 148.51]
MDNSVHNNSNTTHPDKSRASIVNGVREERVSLSTEPPAGVKGGDNGPITVGDYNKLESRLQGAGMEDSVDELQHITDDVMPLSLLLSRLAQFSHLKLQELILDLASKPLPENTLNGNAKGSMNSSINGNVNAGVNGVPKLPSPALEDTSPESLNKKTMILKFIQDLHSRWVKALVITEWARNADEVGKLIDLRTHLAAKLELYNRAFWNMVNLKHEMAFAKVPSPDLKTALEVLSTGAVHWMPDFGYLPKPPLTTQETLHWLNEIEVVLHMRLQLHEYEQIPEPWKEYKIDNGRVTFTVPGEFEVDLTISDEDFDKQFWFLDYRTIFSPSPSKLSDGARGFIEARVNTILETEGLLGCYKYLHELTLTTKIGEFARQAVELSRTGLWTQTLRVERLNRALGIQYWSQSLHTQDSQSWILLGVHSGKSSDGADDPSSPSRLMLQWFRDGKEVKDADIPLDTDTISTEKLLMTVISRHIKYLLSSIYNSLSSKPRYAQKRGRLSLRISDPPHLDCALTMQTLGADHAVLGIGPWSGNFFFADRPPFGVGWANKINTLRNPVTEAPVVLEQLRWYHMTLHLRTLPKPADWKVLPKAPVPLDEVKRVVYSRASTTREPFHAIFLRNSRWTPQWFAMMSLSLGGDRWWTAEGHGIPGLRINIFTELSITPTDLLLPSSPLFSKLTQHATNIMDQIHDFRVLHQQHIQYTARKASPDGHRTTVVLSADMLPLQPDPDGTTQPTWAGRFIQLDYKGPAPITPSEYRESLADPKSVRRQPTRQKVMIEATVGVLHPTKFRLLRHRLDRDVLYDRRLGHFTLRFQPASGAGIIPLLRSRVQSLDRLVDIVDALHLRGKQISPKKITLREIVFSYGNGSPTMSLSNPRPKFGGNKQRSWEVRLNLAAEQGVDVILEAGNPHLRAIDYLRSAANSVHLKKLPAWFVFTLPLYEALEQLHDSWDAILAKDLGTCYVFHKSLDWLTIRFALSGAKNRLVQLDIRPRDRNGHINWHISRAKTDPNINNENDEFNKILKQRVWSISGNGFKGLGNSATAQWDHGIGPLLAVINEALQSLAGTPPPPQVPTQIQQPQQPSPHPQQAQVQEQRQQPQQQQQANPLQGAAVPGRFPHQLQQGQQLSYQQQARLQQQQRQQQQQQQQQQHMHNQNQAQQAQQRAAMNDINTPVVVLD